jgi:LemA protein
MDGRKVPFEAVRTIPWLLFTGVAGVGKREFYDAPAAQETPPTVQF